MIATTYCYEPYGAVTAVGDVIQPMQWSSGYYDSELDLVYYNSRHYNPRDGRWINRDPISEYGGWNLYEFVNNNEIVFNDLRGQNYNPFTAGTMNPTGTYDPPVYTLL